MAAATFRIWRGDASGGAFKDYSTEVRKRMVVLDVVHRIQATQAQRPGGAVELQGGKCGSCSAEINASRD